MSNGEKESQNKRLREHLIQLLEGRQAHLDPLRVWGRFPFELLGNKPKGAPYTPWSLFEHLRIAQWDILEFSRDAGHHSPEFPDGYWPAAEAPENESAWEHSRASFRRDLEAMRALMADPATDLFAPIPHGDGQTVLREAMLVADHNAYHLGQIVLLQKMMSGTERDVYE